MPSAIQSLHRIAAMTSGNDEMPDDAMKEIEACVCAVAAVQEGQHWTGTITFSGSYSGEAHSATSRRRTVNTASQRYEVNVTLMGGAEGGEAIGMAFSSGERKHNTETVDTPWACAVDQGSISRELSGARGAEMGPVQISVRSGGKYTVAFPQPVATGLERTRAYKKREGCQNRFNDRTSESHNVSAGGVGPDVNETIQGETKIAIELKGSQSFTYPDLHLQRNRRATLNWNLSACPAK